MKIEHFTKNNIHYIKKTGDNGSINIYPDPDFQDNSISLSQNPPLPDISSIKKQLDFIIDQLHLKDNFS